MKSGRIVRTKSVFTNQTAVADSPWFWIGDAERASIQIIGASATDPVEIRVSERSMNDPPAVTDQEVLLGNSITSSPAIVIVNGDTGYTYLRARKTAGTAAVTVRFSYWV